MKVVVIRHPRFSWCITAASVKMLVHVILFPTWKLDTSKRTLEISTKFWNVVLEKDGEDQLDRSCEKRRIRNSQVGKKKEPPE